MRHLLIVGIVLVGLAQARTDEPRELHTVAVLIGQVGDKDPERRLEGIRNLGKLGKAAHSAVPVLAQVMDDRVPHVGERAAQALAQVGALPELTRAVRAGNSQTRIHAARALAWFGPEARTAISALRAALSEPDNVLRVAAACALGEIGPEAQDAAPEIARALHGAPVAAQEKILASFLRVGKGTVPLLVQMLRDPAERARAEATFSLGLFGPDAAEAVPALRSALKDRDSSVRVAAAGTLGAIGSASREALPELFQAVGDKEAKVRLAATRSLLDLAASGVAGVVDGLRASERSGNASVLLHTYFGKIPPEYFVSLARDLQSEGPQRRIEAMLILAKFGSDARPAVPLLGRLLSDENEQVRQVAALALARVARGQLEMIANWQDQLQILATVTPGPVRAPVESFDSFRAPSSTIQPRILPPRIPPGPVIRGPRINIHGGTLPMLPVARLVDATKPRLPDIFAPSPVQVSDPEMVARLNRQVALNRAELELAERLLEAGVFQRLLRANALETPVVLRRKLQQDQRGEVRLVATLVIADRRHHLENELIECLRDRSPSVVQGARGALVRLARGTDFGPPPKANKVARERAVARWKSWLTLQRATDATPDADLQAAADRVLGRQTGVLVAVDPEIARLRDELLRAKGQAHDDVLQRLRDEKGVIHTEALVLAIPQLPEEQRAKARDALVKRMTRMTAPTLRDKFAQDDAEVRRAAALACSAKGDKDLISDLIDLLGDSEASVAQAARSSLKKLSGKDFGPGPDELPGEQARAITAWNNWWEKKNEQR